MTWRQALREVLSSSPGKAGVALFAILLAISVYVLVSYPLDFGPRRWSNPAVWADNPKAVPPAWTNWFSATRRVPHTTWAESQPNIRLTLLPEEGIPFEYYGTRAHLGYRFPVDFTYDEAPTFLSFSLRGVVYQHVPPLVMASLERPDGNVVRLYQEQIRGPRPGEQAPYVRHQDTPLRVLLSQEPLAASEMARLLEERYGVEVPESRLLGGGLKKALFGEPSKAQEGAFQPLRGKYTARVMVFVADPQDQVGEVRFVMGGTVYGVMGTDALGRDLWEGLLFGFPIALSIAVVASVLVTVSGAALGTISGYMGGRTDLVIQRVADVVSNVPVLPLLIFLVFIIGPNLFFIILMLVAFSWPGLTILVRSMVLQVRTGQLVEAALSLGASRWRIMLRHVFPTTAPFVLAQMIFFAPSAILAEAGLSFLGLGDPSLPTWGQILEAGFRTGAVYIGYWWWIVPPGVLIVITAMAFTFLALATEPVVNPRLRRRA